MSAYVTDTHAIVWHLLNSPQLSTTARDIFVEADEGWHRIFVPTVSLVELTYLIEKRRLDSALFSRVVTLLSVAGGSYTIASLDLAVARTLPSITRAVAPDMPDRIIAATAQCLGLPLITRDIAISKLTSIQTIW